MLAYSQRDRWSFDSEQYVGFSIPFLCGACSKFLTERSSVANFELPIAAVLSCGHVYHTECLETMTR
ncbi:unnamed protein product [Brassica napus]|uniref:RING-type domain-containing protein n=2 Tax=Brassica TaxID=3705 RepID=A0A3P6GTZ8_BRAOL|nr:unnamed protein product [Brassica napus]VDD62931.1 unnamed protein product [Brassica oleracea]